MVGVGAWVVALASGPHFCCILKWGRGLRFPQQEEETGTVARSRTELHAQSHHAALDASIQLDTVALPKTQKIAKQEVEAASSVGSKCGPTLNTFTLVGWTKTGLVGTSA